MDKSKTKKVLEFLAYIITLIASFVGGQASAHNDIIDLFNKCNIEQRL